MTQQSDAGAGTGAGAVTGSAPDKILRFQFTSLGANSNKWYVYEVYGTGSGARVVGRFGRVGDRGQTKDFGQIGEDGLYDLVEARLRKGYVQVDLHNLGKSPAPAPSATSLGSPHGSADWLRALIFSEAGEAIQSYLNTTVDQLSYSQIKRARELLDQYARHKENALGLHSMGSMLRMAVEEYYRTIPTILPRRIKPDELVSDFDPSEQETRLQQLEAAITSYQVTSTGGTQTAALGAALSLTDPLSDEFRSLRQYITSTAGTVLRTLNIYAVEIPDERSAYIADQRGKSNRALLFHGTKNQNVRHILRSGLIVPRHATHGRAFGDGIYFANKAGKSLNYVGTARDYSAPMMMFLSEVSLGRIYETQGAQSFSGAPKGYDSVMGRAYGGYPYDELIVYSPTQCTVRYLVCFTR